MIKIHPQPKAKTNHVLRLGMMAALFFWLAPLWGQNASDNPNLESFNVTVNFEEIGGYIFPSFYEDPDGLYLPADDLLNLLKIVRSVSSDGQTIKGFVETKQNAYEINLPQKFIFFNGTKFPISKGEAFMDMGVLYLEQSVLNRAFGFTIKFDFRTLTASFKSEFELPVVKLAKLEKAREKLGIKSQGMAYDTILKRDYHWFRGGMLDWSAASTQSQEYANDTRVELGGGSELLGGEANVFLNWSNQYGMKRKQQQYSWRWADNDSKIVKQVQLGRISNRSIASLLSPVDGFVLSNTPTTVRKALGDYRIADFTEPDWVVELYVNNVMVAYTRADASGFYTFSIPIVYGTSDIILRFYGPGGEVRSKEKKFNMPYNMLPSGEIEYRVSGGVLLDSTQSKYGRAEFNYGVAQWLTTGVGMEYLSSLSNNPEIPFFNFTFQPLSSFLITGEYAYKVRAKGTMNVSLPRHSTLELVYAKYVPGQEAITYNYLEERSGSLSIPFRLRMFSGYTKTAFRQNVYSNFTYNSGELMVSAYYRNYNTNLSNFVNWAGGGSSNMYTNIAFGAKIGKNLNFRPSAQYNYTTEKWISIKAELEKKISPNSQLAVRYENSLLAGSQSINFTFRYDLPYMSTYLAPGLSNKKVQASESARGSFAFGSGNKFVYANKSNAVGRSGVSVQTYVDINFNGVHDKNEPFTECIKMRCSGGQLLDRDKDSIIRVVGLEPFVEYTIILDESGFQNLAWRLPFKTIQLTTDPNQFKKIVIPVQPMGEVTGMVLKDDASSTGIGRILINVWNTKGRLVNKVLTESDGFFSYLGLPPGKYLVGVDTMQLRILRYQADPIAITIKEDVQGDIVDAGTIVLHRRPQADDVLAIPQALSVENPDMLVSASIDSLPHYSIFFASDRADVRKEYIGPLRSLAAYLNAKANDTIQVEIQGHTDSDASGEYNYRLSERRALSVKQRLMQMGVNGNRLQTKAFGKTMPLNSNKTAAEKAANRRVIFQKATALNTEVEVGPKPEVRPVAQKNLNLERNRDGVPDWCFLYNMNGRYFIQLGAFKVGENAMKFAEQVRNVIQDKVIIVNEENFVKVQLGYFDNRQSAIQAANILRTKGLLK
jgi:outer membrane protein OmpA-like peptidoglycan-associated protein